MRNIDLNVGIDKKSLVELFSTAFYGCDWAVVCTLDEENCIDDRLEPNYVRTRCREDKWADRLFGGGHLVIYDYYDLDDNDCPAKHMLDLNKVNEGLKKAMTRECPYDWADFVNEDDDYFTGNNLIQVCIFGRVIYG